MLKVGRPLDKLDARLSSTRGPHGGSVVPTAIRILADRSVHSIGVAVFAYPTKVACAYGPWLPLVAEAQTDRDVAFPLGELRSSPSPSSDAVHIWKLLF